MYSHSHPLDYSILRSRAGVRAVLVSLGVLGAAAVAQALVYALSGSVALLADLIHNAGDALTAVPVGTAFLLRSGRAERWAGYAVVLAIFASACVALYETVLRLRNPQELEHLWALAGAGLIGYGGNELAARVRLRAGRRLDSAALVADGKHARVDAVVSLGVVAGARRRTWRRDRRSAHRPRDHARDPQDRVGLMANSTPRASPLTTVACRPNRAFMEPRGAASQLAEPQREGPRP